MRIIGISSDSVSKQKEFAKKHDLKYTLLADTEKQARKAYDVNGAALLGLAPRRANFSLILLVRLMPKPAERVTFIIDRSGTVKAVEDSSISMGAHTKLVEKWAGIFAKEQGTQIQAAAAASS